MNKDFLLILLALILTGCDQEKVAEKQSEPERVAEAWVSSPHEKWPQMVLTNHAEFKGHTALHGASSFLLKTDSGAVLAATARHLLGENGGVEPEVSLMDLDASLGRWFMHPRTKPNERVQITGSATRPEGRKNDDWVLLNVAEGWAAVATPLKIRPEPVKVGEKVFLIGVSYAEPDVAQKVYSGVVTARGYVDRFRYSITPHVDITGFSGAPIVDEKGLLVGVMTVWFQPRIEGELWTEAGGEDAQTALALIKAP